MSIIERQIYSFGGIKIKDNLFLGDYSILKVI